MESTLPASSPGAGPSTSAQPEASGQSREASTGLDNGEQDQPEAGPSRLPTSRPSNVAPHRHLPKTAYRAIEYLGPVSHPSAILQLASQGDINDCFNSPSSDNPLLEIHYRSDKTGAPIRGYRIPTQKLLVKVVKRRRKGGEGGVFTSEVLGPINQTVRFRSMADWHYTPNMDGPTQDLLATLKNLDYESILDYQFPDLKEEYTIPASPDPDKPADPDFSHHSILDLQPIPMFSERRLPLIYNYRQPHATSVMEYHDPMTGEIKQRYYNTSRIHGFAPITIGHLHPLGEVPKEPEPKIKGKVPKLKKELLAKMKQIFIERPVWMRAGLLAQFTPEEKHIIVESKSYIPACAYMFGAGPYWKCYARLGYDPRQHQDAHVFQRTYFYISVIRNNAKPVFATPEPGEEEDEPTVDKSSHQAWADEQAKRIAEGKREPLDQSREYIFDGQILHRDKPDYQLCDITDPTIRKSIDDARILTDHCDPRNGWYTAAGLDNIREMIKAKYVWVRDKNEPAPDKLCYPFIQAIEASVVEQKAEAEVNEDAVQAESEDVEMAE